MEYIINKEKEGGVCVSWSLFGRLEEPKNISPIGLFYKNVGNLLGSIFGRYKMVTLLYYILVSLFQVEEFGQVFQY